MMNLMLPEEGGIHPSLLTKVVEVVEKETVSGIPDVKTSLIFLKEVIADDLEHIQKIHTKENMQTVDNKEITQSVDNKEITQSVDHQEIIQSVDHQEIIQSVNDLDARVGHKTADTS